MYKLPLLIALMITVGIGVAIHVSRQELVPSQAANSMVRTVADSLIPKSYTYLGYASLSVCLTVLAGAIARDLKAGAFEFFFSRPVRPIDYVMGRIGGAFVLLAPILLIAPVLLTVYRLALTGEVDRIVDTLPWIPKAIAVGFCATLVQASVSLAFGAITQSAKYAVAAYAAFIAIFGTIVDVIASTTGRPDLAALNIASAISGLASGLFDSTFVFDSPPPSLAASFLALLGYTALSITIITLRVRQAQRAGMGGG